MTSKTSEKAFLFSRRQFALWAAASGVAACGGGSGGGAPEPVEPPPPGEGGLVSRVAGLFGGAGFAVDRPMQGLQPRILRLPPHIEGLSFNSKRDLRFVGWHGNDRRIGTQINDAEGYYFAASSPSLRGGLFDARDRYLVIHPVASGGVRIAYLDGEKEVALAGSATGATLLDGQGGNAWISSFHNPLLAGDGLVYFQDQVPSTRQWMLRTLSPEGTVTTLLELPADSLLLKSPDGGVRRFIRYSLQGGRDEWAQLVRDAIGAYAWSVMSNRWPNGIGVPLAPGRNEDTYFVYQQFPSAHWVTLIALNHDSPYGGPYRGHWALPGPFVQAVQTKEGGVFVASWNGAANEVDNAPGVYSLGGRPSWPPQLWLGASANAGTQDGLDFARLDFTQGADTLGDGAGGLYISSGGSKDGTPAPVRRVTSVGQVSSMALTRSGSNACFARAYGYLVTHDHERGVLMRAPLDGRSGWENWISTSSFGKGAWPSSGLQVLRVDAAGLLWFATRFVPVSKAPGGFAGSGQSLIGTINAAGQVQMVAGDPQVSHTAQTYPLLEQRPWYMDITDMAFEGGSQAVSWVLCNRVVLDGGGEFVRYVPELIRLDSAGRQAFALPSAQETDRLAMHYRYMCVLPDRPGEVFLSSRCGVHRWTQAKGLELLAGQKSPALWGVVLNSRPAGLNEVKFIAPGPDRNSLYVGSENSVLRLSLPA